MSEEFEILRGPNHYDPLCPDGNTCEHVIRFASDPGVRYLITKDDVAPAKIAAVSHLIGPGERLTRSTLIPEVE
jgi:hypothetical protein